MKHILLLAILICSAGCTSVEVSNFVHEPTQEVRNTLSWERQTPSLPADFTMPTEGIAIIPDFTKFWPGYSPDGYLYICTSGKRPIFLESASLAIPGKVGQEEIPLRITTEPQTELRDGIWLSRERVIERSRIQEDLYRDIDELLLIIHWREPETGGAKESSFRFKKHTRKSLAWQT